MPKHTRDSHARKPGVTPAPEATRDERYQRARRFAKPRAARGARKVDAVAKPTQPGGSGDRVERGT